MTDDKLIGTKTNINFVNFSNMPKIKYATKLCPEIKYAQNQIVSQSATR